MTIPANIILIWAGTNASIPAGFSRVTAFDGRFSKGAHDTATQNVTGGADNHTHTSPTHSHLLNSHTHTYDLADCGTSNTDDMSNQGGAIINPANHNHYGNTSTGMSTSYTSSDSLTYASQANNSLPPFYEVIFIQSSGVATPTNVIALFNSSVLPAHWHKCDGGSSSPDLRNKYLRGAAAGQNAGATGGGLTHSHDISHTHTPASHTHSGGASAANQGGSDNSNGGVYDVDYRHGHNVVLNSNTAPIAANADVVALSDSVEPLFKKLHAIQKEVTTNEELTGVIGLYTGAIGDLAASWRVCDGTHGTPDMRDYHLKIANVDGELATTGGSNTHIHTATSHGHSSGGVHTHSGQSDGHVHTVGIDGMGPNATNRNIAAHNAINVQNVSATYANANTTADSSNNEPSYLTAIFVQYQGANTLAGTFTADAILVNARKFTADGIVKVPTYKTFTIDGVVKRYSTPKTFSADALIIDTGYFLDAVKIKRPKVFTREYVYQKTDFTTLNGKTMRDMSSNKEKYILTMENVSTSLVDTIQGIINKGVPVIFLINEKGLNDEAIITFSKSVWPYIGSIVYDDSGGDYRATIQLELIEVT